MVSTKIISVVGSPPSLFCSFLSAIRERLGDGPRQGQGVKCLSQTHGTQLFWRNCAKEVKCIISVLQTCQLQSSGVTVAGGGEKGVERGWIQVVRNRDLAYFITKGTGLKGKTLVIVADPPTPHGLMTLGRLLLFLALQILSLKQRSGQNHGFP